MLCGVSSWSCCYTKRNCLHQHNKNWQNRSRSSGTHAPAPLVLWSRLCMEEWSALSLHDELAVIWRSAILPSSIPAPHTPVESLTWKRVVAFRWKHLIEIHQIHRKPKALDLIATTDAVESFTLLLLLFLNSPTPPSIIRWIFTKIPWGGLMQNKLGQKKIFFFDHAETCSKVALHPTGSRKTFVVKKF